MVFLGTTEQIITKNLLELSLIALNVWVPERLLHTQLEKFKDNLGAYSEEQDEGFPSRGDGL